MPVPSPRSQRRRGRGTGVVIAALSVACGTGPPAGAPPSAAVPTFTRDIAPLVFQHCLPCHRRGQAAPFGLETYADVATRATAIADVTSARRMPPWLPDTTGPPLVGARRMRDEHLAVIRRWADAGAPEGDVRDLPAAPTFASTWESGSPDLVLTLAKPYVLRAGGDDVYRNVVLPIALAQTRFVRTVEFRPGVSNVHHAVIRVDRTRQSRRRDGEDGQPGFDGMAAADAEDPQGHFIGWAPGRGPIVAPEHLPWRLERGSDLVIELHLLPGASPTSVQPTVALFFSDRGPTDTPVTIVMGSKGLDIPPGDARYVAEDRYQLPVDVTVLSVYPHAHHLARDMRVQAELPGGEVRPLLHIPRWSFHWQQDYRFVTPIPLPRGTTVVMTYTYDNSPSNPHHRGAAPRRVTWGPRSSDEMATLGLQLLPPSAADAAVLTASFAAHAARADVAGAEVLVRVNPTHAGNRALLGASYVRVGRYADAVPHLERALALDPANANAENHLGAALVALGRVPQGIDHFRRAVALSPRDGHLRFNLARVLQGAGRVDEAEREYGLALAADASLAAAHHNLGVLLFEQGRLPEAVRHLQRAADLAPDSPGIHGDLGGALAQAGQFEAARTHLRRALALDPQQTAARENLRRLDQIPPR